jgi:hypothetical protein
VLGLQAYTPSFASQEILTGTILILCPHTHLQAFVMGSPWLVTLQPLHPAWPNKDEQGDGKERLTKEGASTENPSGSRSLLTALCLYSLAPSAQEIRERQGQWEGVRDIRMLSRASWYRA